MVERAGGEFTVEEIELLLRKVCRGATPQEGDRLVFRQIKRGFGWVFEPATEVPDQPTFVEGSFDWGRVGGFPANGFGNTVVTVTGVEAGDIILVNSSEVPDQIGWTAHVSAADEVTIQWQNDSGTSVSGPLTMSMDYQIVRSP